MSCIYKARASYAKRTKESFALPFSQDFRATVYPVFDSTLLEKCVSTGVSPEKKQNKQQQKKNNNENHKQLKKCLLKKHLVT